MRATRLGALAALTLGAALGLPGAAGAQGCGASYTVRSGDTLGAIATRCATSVEALLGANPRISNPARLTVGWELAVPGATGARAAESLVEEWTEKRDASAAPLLATGRYTVAPGDSMARIATRLGVPLAALIAANEGVDPFRLKPGQNLALPGGPEGEAGATDGGAADGAAAEAQGDADDGAVDDALRPEAEGEAPADSEADAAEAPAPTYTVQRGDTLARIARRLGVPLAALRAANAGVDPARLRPGQALALPPGAGAPTTAAEPPASEADAGAAAEGEAAEPAEVPPGAPPRRPDALARRTAAGSAAEPAATPAAEPAGKPEAAPSAVAGGPVGAESAVAAGATDRADTAAAEPAPAADLAPAPERLLLEGRIRKGAECPVLVTPDGRTFSLVSQNHGFTIGDYVAIEGEPVEMTFCTQGRTIRVTTMTDKPAPHGG